MADFDLAKLADELEALVAQNDVAKWYVCAGYCSDISAWTSDGRVSIGETEERSDAELMVLLHNALPQLLPLMRGSAQ